MLLNKEKIKESFSRAAATYDEASDFQKETAAILIDRILSGPGRRDVVLDVGMGTGSVTQTLALRLHRRIYGCDIAWGMVLYSRRKAEGISTMQADAEYIPCKDSSLDIIFSNIAYHWLNNIEAAFGEVRRILKIGGRFYFSILVNGSLVELQETMRKVTHRDYGEGVFPEAEMIRRYIWGAGLNLVWDEERLIKRYYNDGLELIRRLKKIGAMRILRDNVFGMGKRRLFFEMIEKYGEAFNENGKVFATYKVILGCAVKR